MAATLPTTTTTSPTPAPDEGGRAPVEMEGRARMLVLLAVLLGLFLSALDQTVVGTALPRITTDLGGSDLYTWVVTVYLLASTVTVPVYGKLSDVYGRKPLLLIGISIFLVGSALCGLSQNIGELIAFRALQGLGAGALFPISLAIIGDLFSARERGRYQGLFGGVFGLSFIIGPLVGGALTDSASWRFVFYVNLPIGLAALTAIASQLPAIRRPLARARDLDYLGVAVFSAGVVPLLLGLTNKGQTDASGQAPSWFSPSVGGYLLCSALLLSLFVVIESRAREPIVPLSLFRDRTYSAAIFAVLAVSTGMFAAVIYLPRYFQAVRGISATKSGYEIWPLLVGLIGASVLSGQLISRTGRYRAILLGAATLVIVGMVLMTRTDATTPTLLLWAPMLLIGLGIGPGMSGYTTVVQNIVPVRMLGAGTSTLTFFRQVGGSVGLAIAGTVFTARFHTHLPDELARRGAPPQLSTRLVGGGGGGLTNVGDLGPSIAAHLPASQRSLVPSIVDAVHSAFGLAVGEIFLVGVVSAVLGLGAVLLIREIPLRGYGGRRSAGAEASPGASAPRGTPVTTAAARRR